MVFLLWRWFQDQRCEEERERECVCVRESERERGGERARYQVQAGQIVSTIDTVELKED